jgi:hypothetical protein
MSQRGTLIQWQELKKTETWLQGWKWYSGPLIPCNSSGLLHLPASQSTNCCMDHNSWGYDLKYNSPIISLHLLKHGALGCTAVFPKQSRKLVWRRSGLILHYVL